MNENKILNDKPIFVAKRRIFRGLILAAIGLMIALQVYFSGQKPEVDVVYWVFGVGLFGIGGVFFSLYNAYI